VKPSASRTGDGERDGDGDGEGEGVGVGVRGMMRSCLRALSERYMNRKMAMGYSSPSRRSGRQTSPRGTLYAVPRLGNHLSTSGLFACSLFRFQALLKEIS